MEAQPILRLTPWAAHTLSMFPRMVHKKSIPITEFTYDLAASANQGEFTFTFSRGIGSGQ